jgi:hypothetical protein
VGAKVLIAGPFTLFIVSFLLSSFAKYTFFPRLDETVDSGYARAQYQVRIGLQFVCYFLGLLWFGVAILINVL